MTSSITETPLAALRSAGRALHRCDETTALTALIPLATLPEAGRIRAADQAHQLITHLRRCLPERSGVAALLHEYALSSTEGVALMCLAEALLRIPDAATADRLINDKLGQADWAKHVPNSEQFFVNATNWALAFTEQWIHLENREETLAGVGKNLISHLGAPVIREALRAAMRGLGEQFILGRDMPEALQHAADARARGWRHSFDMLGEAALGQADANRYASAYRSGIDSLGQQARQNPASPLAHSPGISIKLSALHPRYEMAQRERVMKELLPTLIGLACAARTQGVPITFDAEESDRLEISLDLFEALAFEQSLAGWDGLGLAVQAYQKRAPAVIDWLSELARCSAHRFNIRLVKGAYWDSEIKLAQERGLSDYPVYTNKAATDISWLACAAKLLDDPRTFYPQFATHNALCVARIIEMARQRKTSASEFEFQRLHGMGRELYEPLIGQYPCRVYAPVGSHTDLLAYLVRRLLENGANSSFVHLLEDERIPPEELLADPLSRWIESRSRTPLPAPAALFAPQRKNSAGKDMNDAKTLGELAHALDSSRQTRHQAGGSSASTPTAAQEIRSPADAGDLVGIVFPAQPGDIEAALQKAPPAARIWDKTPATARAACLEHAADLFEQHSEHLMALIVREGGRTLPDALNECREAIDFCRYYAARARADFSQASVLPGPTGEHNQLTLHGRGVFACISPWNFPLAIFTGQIAAALAAGNAVIAKPAGQTPLIAAAAVSLFHTAGIPAHALQLLIGDGRTGAALVADPRIDGVAFTGSTDTARYIHQSLASRGKTSGTASIAPLIAETGGLNVMIADSSTLPEQLVRDVISSAFNSAGQRCSALRVLYLQDDIADRVLPLLAEAMQELSIGDPSKISTDIGPLIDRDALSALQNHQQWLERHGRLISTCKLPDGLPQGHFFAPQAWEIDRLDQLPGEIFGPILHVIRWQARELDTVLQSIDDSAFGLTLGIHSRIDATVNRIVAAVRVGNIYVNRNMIGAVVGVQPFGGERLSGTGPKAGGPNYLLRFATERCLTINTAAAGGNVRLLTETPAASSRGL